MPADLYTRMTELATSVPAGSDGLRCEPFFTGSRTDPALRASFSGLSPVNFTPGHLTRALLEGMADGFYSFFEQMKAAVGTAPVPGGRGQRRAPEPAPGPDTGERFEMPLLIPSHTEEAAVGAAIAAAVGLGLFTDLDTAAAALLDYTHTVDP